MPTFTRRALTVEARQVTKESVAELAEWCGGVEIVEHDPFDDSKTYAAINVPTLTGMVRVSEGDYVAKGPQGSFFKADAIELHAHYEETP